jgi:hypothetical protein
MFQHPWLSKFKAQSDIAYTLLAIAKEFGISYEELMETPIVSIPIYVKYLERYYETQKEAQRKAHSKKR